MDELRAAIDQRLSELNPLIERAPFTLDIAQAALMRVIEGRPPSGSNNEQFRDCCTWEHCLRQSKHYEVHLVMGDGDFYQGKKTENGLAEKLCSELASAKATVFAFQSIPKLIEHIGPSVPAHDAEALGGRIAEVAREALGPPADTADFILGELTKSRVSVTPTRGPLNLLATFDLTYSLVNKSEQDAQARLNPELTASGSCALSGAERSIRDLRLDASTIRWTDISGKVVTQRHLYLYAHGFAAGTASLGVGGSLGKGSVSVWSQDRNVLSRCARARDEDNFTLRSGFQTTTASDETMRGHGTARSRCDIRTGNRARPVRQVAGGMTKWYEPRAADEAVIQILRAFLTVPIVSSRARHHSAKLLILQVVQSAQRVGPAALVSSGGINYANKHVGHSERTRCLCRT